jgi:hypothetical protein
LFASRPTGAGSVCGDLLYKDLSPEVRSHLSASAEESEVPYKPAAGTPAFAVFAQALGQTVQMVESKCERVAKDSRF